MIAELIESAARERPSAVAAIDDLGGSISYSDLIARSDAILAELGTARRVVLLEGRNSVDWLVAYVACLRGRHPALLTPGGNPDTQTRLETAFLPFLRMTAATGFRPETTDFEGTADPHPELALLLSTSGSTGSAKCVRLSRTNIDSNAASICEYLKIDAAERGVVGLPTHYSYGLSIVNSHLRAGATLLLTNRSAIEPAYWAFCAEHGATSFAGVPHSYELLARIDLAKQAPPTLRYFTQAGGRLPEAQVRFFGALAALHGWRFYVMYGQTEATARMAYLPPEDAVRKAGSIGRPIPGGAFELIDQDGVPITAAEQVGELVYRGPNVMMGYATSPADFAAPPGPQRLPTGDLAMRDADGHFAITGRLSRFVKIFGNRIGLDDVERLLAAAGHEAIATGIDDQLLVVTRDGNMVADIAARLREQLKLPDDYFRVRAVEAYPLLATGKIDYSALKAGLTPPAPAGNAADAHDPAAVAGLFRASFGEAADDETASFRSLGGDSLNFVVMALSLERLVGTLPADWPQMSIGALTAVARDAAPGALALPQRTIPRNLDTLRGLACVMVVMYHVVGNTPAAGLRLAAASPWHHFVDSFQFVRMPLFTAMAGFLYAAMPAPYEGLGHFLRRKAALLLVPLVFATLIYWTLRTAGRGDLADLRWSFLHGYAHLWFLYALMAIFAIVGILDTVVGTSWKFWMAMLAAAACLRAVVPPIMAFSINGALYLLPFFVLGMLFYRQPLLLRSRSLVALAVAVAIPLLIVQQYALAGLIPGGWQLSIAFPCGSALALILMRFFPRIEPIEILGAYSFTIYLWHPLANAAVRAGMIKIGIQPLSLLFLFGLSGGILLPILLHIVMIRAPRWLSLPVIGK